MAPPVKEQFRSLQAAQLQVSEILRFILALCVCQSCLLGVDPAAFDKSCWHLVLGGSCAVTDRSIAYEIIQAKRGAGDSEEEVADSIRF